MLQLGNFNKLVISRLSPHGLYLTDGNTELLLPNKFVPTEYEFGDMMDVFVFKDSEDRLTATTTTPYAQVGDFAFLEVKDTNSRGAFLDWGLEKDLFVPFKEQNVRMTIGRAYIVYLYIDTLQIELLLQAKSINSLKVNQIAP